MVGTHLDHSHQKSQVSADFMTQESSTIKIFHCFWIMKDFSLRFIFNMIII